MAILGMVSAVAGFVKVRYLIDKAIIDNMIFRCHYRITSALLFVCCIIVTANNLIGDPIACINDGAVPGHVINTYCWITYTFTIPGLHGQNVGSHVAQSGVGPETDDGGKTYHSYYQWVPFMLFFQGVMFYFPHWVWKNWEDGKMRMISDGMRGMIHMTEDDKKSRISRLIKYISQSFGTHNSYSFGYFIAEVLNFVNVILNIFMVDKFLGGAFMTYGTDVLRFSNMNQENRSDPMVEIFPRITKCTFHKYGATGSIQKHDAMCVLALNILNEKIYIFLWFWFILLAVLSGLALVYSAVIILMPTTREVVFRRRIGTTKTSDDFFKFINKCEIGDFLLLHLLSQNINAKQFREVVNKLSKNGRAQTPNLTPSAPSTLNMTPPGIEMQPIDPLLNNITMEEEKKRKNSM